MDEVHYRSKRNSKRLCCTPSEVWRSLRAYGLGPRAIGIIAVFAIAAITMYFRYPGLHVDAVATILGLAIGIPGLVISIRLVLAAKSASEAAREAAEMASRELESLDAYRRSSIAIGDLDHLKTALLKREWKESRIELSSVLGHLRSIIDSGLALEAEDAEGLAAAIKSFDAVEGRIAEAILKEQEPQNVVGLFRSVAKQMAFLSSFAGKVRRFSKKDD